MVGYVYTVNGIALGIFGIAVERTPPKAGGAHEHIIEYPNIKRQHPDSAKKASRARLFPKKRKKPKRGYAPHMSVVETPRVRGSRMSAATYRFLAGHLDRLTKRDTPTRANGAGASFRIRDKIVVRNYFLFAFSNASVLVSRSLTSVGPQY